MNEVKIRTYLEVIKRATARIEELLSSEEVLDTSRLDKVKALLKIDNWPETVPIHALKTPSRQDHIDRANAVLDTFLSNSLDGADFLDYGCGEGYIAFAASSRGVLSSTGFDIKKPENSFPNVILTNDKKDLKLYDAIFLYDVVDHADNQSELLDHVHSLLKPNGIVYVRCHPWCSKHATHLFRNGLNKAWFHLFATSEELKELGYQSMYTKTELYYANHYKFLFRRFNVIKQKIHKNPVPEFFLNGEIKNLILQAVKSPSFFNDMEVEFVDMELTL